MSATSTLTAEQIKANTIARVQQFRLAREKATEAENVAKLEQNPFQNSTQIQKKRKLSDLSTDEKIQYLDFLYHLDNDMTGLNEKEMYQHFLNNFKKFEHVIDMEDSNIVAKLVEKNASLKHRKQSMEFDRTKTRARLIEFNHHKIIDLIDSQTDDMQVSIKIPAGIADEIIVLLEAKEYTVTSNTFGEKTTLIIKWDTK